VSLDGVEDLPENISNGAAGHNSDHNIIHKALKELKLLFNSILDSIKEKVGKGELYQNPYDFGAIGNGVADDTTAVQSAYNAAVISGGTVLLSKGTFNIPGHLIMDTPGVSLRGAGGVLKGGTIKVGASSSATSGQAWAGTVIDGLIYDGNDAFGSNSKAITLKNCRGFKILDSRIGNVGKAISVDTLDGATGFHSVAMIGLHNVSTFGVNYATYVNTGSDWQVCSDWDITGCVSNIAKITNHYISGIDGIQFSNNVCFMLNYGSTDTVGLSNKRYNVFVGQGDQLHFHDSNLF
jgi:hypothetical protein